jgi:hypothetical protein
MGTLLRHEEGGMWQDWFKHALKTGAIGASKDNLSYIVREAVGIAFSMMMILADRRLGKTAGFRINL